MKDRQTSPRALRAAFAALAFALFASTAAAQLRAPAPGGSGLRLPGAGSEAPAGDAARPAPASGGAAQGGAIREIDRVVAAHRPESPSRVVMKLNSLIDGPVIQAIYRASQAGVPVDLIVRGIAGLRPGIPGVSENVRVISIVGRFLEHARVFAFTADGETRYYIGSADMMARNLDNRVELVTPIDDPIATREIQAVLDLQLADTALGWELGPDGEWAHRVTPAGEEPVNSQEALMARAAQAGRG